MNTTALRWVALALLMTARAEAESGAFMDAGGRSCVTRDECGCGELCVGGYCSWRPVSIGDVCVDDSSCVPYCGETLSCGGGRCAIRAPLDAMTPVDGADVDAATPRDDGPDLGPDVGSDVGPAPTPDTGSATSDAVTVADAAPAPGGGGGSGCQVDAVGARRSGWGLVAMAALAWAGSRRRRA